MAIVASLRNHLSGLFGSVASEVITLTDKYSWSAVQDFAGGLTGNVTGDITGDVTGDVTAATVALAGAGALRLGTGEAVTIDTGVATITRPFVVLDAEGAGTTDQLDTITYTGAVAGQLLLLTVNATDTITVDDANINLAAATRAIAPGGSLLLFFDGTEWTELHFTAATDNT